MLKRRPIRLAGALADRGGAAAVEFALIAPVLILLYFGLAQLSSAIIAARHTNQASASLGDLVGQCANLNDSDAANILSAATDILAPLPVTTLKLRVSSIVQNSNSTTDYRVQWSKTPSGQSGFSPLTWGVPPPNTLPAGLTTNQGDTVIMSEAVYQFQFPIDLFNGLLHFDDYSYYKPRKSQQVTYTGPIVYGGTNSNISCYAS